MADINFERKRAGSSLGWILMLVVAVAVVFLIWWLFGSSREGAQERQPDQSGSIELRVDETPAPLVRL